MKIRKFRTRRMWSNTLLVLWLSPFALLVGVILVALTNDRIILLLMVGFISFGVLVALFRDLRNRSTYIVGGEKMVLHDGRYTLNVPMADLVDASMVDRMAAREYIRSKIRSSDLTKSSAQAALTKEITRFCSVDLGLRTLTFGLGRNVIDRMPQSKNDLVLLRLRNGKDYFLSPMDNVELSSMINRLIERREVSKA